jgi:hypothetical protein
MPLEARDHFYPWIRPFATLERRYPSLGNAIEELSKSSSSPEDNRIANADIQGMIEVWDGTPVPSDSDGCIDTNRLVNS